MPLQKCDKLGDQDFTNPYCYKEKFTSPYNPIDVPNFKYL